MMFFDPLYFLLVGPALLLAFWAQSRVKGAYRQWSRVPTARHLTGREAARIMLQSAGLALRIEPAQGGQLSDHYDPRTRTLRLSPDVYSGDSIAAVGIACHEAGHALQHAQGYAPLQLRTAIVPFAALGGKAAFILLIAGMLLHIAGLALLGVIAFGITVIFQIVTLPVEFDASRRAKIELSRLGLITGPQEQLGVDKVLNAAAMTYVAATVAAIAQLIYFLVRSGFLGGRGN